MTMTEKKFKIRKRETKWGTLLDIPELFPITDVMCNDMCDHVFFTKEDFTKEEIERKNVLAVYVIEQSRKICNFCGYEEKN